MTITEAITKAYLHAMRKAVPPASGTSKHSALLIMADSMQKLWAAEPNTEWDSLYELISIGTVSTTDTYDLDDTIQYISQNFADGVLLTNGTDTKTYAVVKPNQLYARKEQQVVARIGSTLKFPKAFTSGSSVLGYEIQVPSIIYPEDITSGTQDVQVDDPMWLVYMMAAEFVRNDVTKRDQRDSLLELAGQHMERMKQNNSGQIEIVGGGFIAEGWSF